MKPTINNKGQQGFTLVELAIVLVIIGLIIGGVLVGQDMIKSAEVRATVGQVEKYNAAVNTFRGKYNALPGDMPQAQSLAFGLFQLTNAATVGQGDGNGLIEGGGAGVTAGVGETLIFWRHLSDATLVDGAFASGALVTAATGVPAAAVTNIPTFLPPAKIGRGNSFVVYANNGQNYYQLISVAGISTAGVYTFNAGSITPIEAYNMDLKTDDGLPNTGAVLGRDNGTALNGVPSFTAASTAANCTMGTAGVTATYNRVAATGGNDPSCSLRFRLN